MQSTTGRWVSGDDFFDREADLKILKKRIVNGNHILLTGHRRMGKTSILQEIGRQLQHDGWTFLYCDLERSSEPEDVIAEIVATVQHGKPSSVRFFKRWLKQMRDSIEEISFSDFRLKLRAEINDKNWRLLGENIIEQFSDQENPTLLVLDEMPVFLKRLVDQDGNALRVGLFLSWLRAELQRATKTSPVLVVSGSIGLAPMLRRLGMPEKINYLYSYQLQPWDKDHSIRCIETLAHTQELRIENGVAEAMYETLGIGIPHHIQSFFGRLIDYATKYHLDSISVKNVSTVYHSEMLGPAGQVDLDHYRSRLQNALCQKSYFIADIILTEVATQSHFNQEGRIILEKIYGEIIENISQHVVEVLDVLTHDGYLVRVNGRYTFAFRLLKDWWGGASYRDNYVPLHQLDQGLRS